jgi:hypothetical protein
MRVSARPPPGLTGYRYLLAVVVLVVLAAAPMLVAVTAGLTTLTGSPPPDPEPFVQPARDSAPDPADHDSAPDPADRDSAPDPADHDLRGMVDPDRRSEPHDRGGVEYR